MRVLVHDFGGHPAPVQLSRSLAERGHLVRYVYGPAGPLQPFTPHPDDADSLELRYLDTPMDGEAYGQAAVGALRAFQPDVVLSAGAPLDVQRLLFDAAREASARFVYWVQALPGLAMERRLRAKGGLRGRVLGKTVGARYASTERELLTGSDALVLADESFADLLPEVRTHRAAHVIPNWASPDAFPVRPRDNAWAKAQRFPDNTRRFVYVGPLDRSLDVRFFLVLAHRYPIELVVVAQGVGVERLRSMIATQRVTSIRLLPPQPPEVLPDVLGAADALIGLGAYASVPPFLPTYLCAGRPVLLAAPPASYAARILTGHDAGAVAAITGPTHAKASVKALADAGKPLVWDQALRERMGANARAYAERHFDLDAITDRFEAALAGSQPITR